MLAKKIIFLVIVGLTAFYLSMFFQNSPIQNVEYGKPDEISPTMYDTLTKLIAIQQNSVLTKYINNHYTDDGYISTEEYVLIAQQQLAINKPLQSELKINYSLKKAKSDFEKVLPLNQS